MNLINNIIKIHVEKQIIMKFESHYSSIIELANGEK